MLKTSKMPLRPQEFHLQVQLAPFFLCKFLLARAIVWFHRVQEPEQEQETTIQVMLIHNKQLKSLKGDSDKAEFLNPKFKNLVKLSNGDKEKSLASEAQALYTALLELIQTIL